MLEVILLKSITAASEAEIIKYITSMISAPDIFWFLFGFIFATIIFASSKVYHNLLYVISFGRYKPLNGNGNYLKEEIYQEDKQALRHRIDRLEGRISRVENNFINSDQDAGNL